MPDFPERPIYAQLARVGKAVASPVRLRLLDLLDGRERTVEELAQEAGIPFKNTSAQLRILAEAQLVSGRRDGVHIRYTLADPEVSRWLAQLQAFAEHRLADLRQAVEAHLGDMPTPATPADLTERRPDQGLVIVDVRRPGEYREGHVPGAVSIPHDELPQRVSELPLDADIVVYCQGPYCVVSPDAVRRLRQHGYRARSLAGGFIAWRRSGGAVSREPQARRTPPTEAPDRSAAPE